MRTTPFSPARLAARLSASTFLLALALAGCDGQVGATSPGADGGPGHDAGGSTTSDGGPPPPRSDAAITRGDGGITPRDPSLTTHPTSDGPWVNATGNLADMPSECGNTPLVSAKPDEDLVIAGVALHGLFASTDGGASWHPLGTGAGSDVITNRPSAIVYDPVHPDVFWESGIYNGGGVYRTDDDGVTFHRLGDIGHDDLVAIDTSDPERRTLLAGGHEQSQTLYRSTDGGATFTNIGAHLPAGSAFSSYPLVLGPSVFLLGCSGWGDGTPGVFRSEDGGATFQVVSTEAANNTPLRAYDGTIYWPLLWGSGMIRSEDDGVTWERIVDGGVVTSAAPIELPDGRIATLSGSAVVVSQDRGATWVPVTAPLPYGDAVGVTYSPAQRAFFLWHFSCGDRVLPDAIMRHDFDWAAP